VFRPSLVHGAFRVAVRRLTVLELDDKGRMEVAGLDPRSLASTLGARKALRGRMREGMSCRANLAGV
jgi:hypothetical protein